MPDWELWLAATAQLQEENILPCVTSPGKDHGSKFEVWFLLKAYSFHAIVKLKNHKSGTVYVDARGKDY